ncbi:hypothetical protein [Paraburkholderia saeva]|uniref:hypothetical protein n=1 Tax=Paraburkholderia saeva TaxID=2777537 RepID=UPI001E35AEB2|nr:hypothetical protein [Paraburkholderia saeva]
MIGREEQAARSLAAKINKMIQAEVVRCERSMTPAAWAEHQAWIEENITASARLWMRAQASGGKF